MGPALGSNPKFPFGSVLQTVAITAMTTNITSMSTIKTCYHYTTTLARLCATCNTSSTKTTTVIAADAITIAALLQYHLDKTYCNII